MTRGGWLPALLGLGFLFLGCSNNTEPTPPPAEGPLAPVWMHVAFTYPDSMRIGWTDASALEFGFEVWRSTRSEDGYAPIDTLEADAPGYTDTRLVSGQRYYYKVRAFDQIGRFGEFAGPVWGAAVENRSPVIDLTPGAMQPTDGAQGLEAVTYLSWTSTDADGDALVYDVHFSDSRADLLQRKVVSGGTATRYDLTETLENTRFYYWRVVAQDPHGATIVSPFFSFGTKVEHVDVPAGYFVRGDCGAFYEHDPNTHCPEERVLWVDDFNIDRYEVSNQLFAQFLQSRLDGKWVVVDNGLVLTNNPEAQLYAKVYPDGDEHAGISFDASRGTNGLFLPRPGRENQPVVEVSWIGAQAFAEFTGRWLPTEFEWEKAARGTRTTYGDLTITPGDSTVTVGIGAAYPWGNEVDARRFNYSGSGDPSEARVGVGTTEAGFYDGRTHGGYATRDGSSEYGAHDMAGNVAEWCLDIYAPYQGGANEGMRVVKGGGWRSLTVACQTFWRQAAFPDSSDNNIGFRTVAPGLEGAP